NGSTLPGLRIQVWDCSSGNVNQKFRVQLDNDANVATSSTGSGGAGGSAGSGGAGGSAGAGGRAGAGGAGGSGGGAGGAGGFDPTVTYIIQPINGNGSISLDIAYGGSTSNGTAFQQWSSGVDSEKYNLVDSGAGNGSYNIKMKA